MPTDNKGFWSPNKNTDLNIFLTTRPNFFDQNGLVILEKVFALDKTPRKVVFHFDESIEQNESLSRHLQDTQRQNVLFTKDYKNAQFDFAVIFGGDGSVVWANKFLKNYPRDLPLIAFNMGSVGFISKFKCDELDEVLATLRDLINGEEPKRQFRLECNTVLKSTLRDAEGSQLKTFSSVNEIVIEKSNTYANWLDVSVDGIELISLNADGMLFATQTGSTAYNASVNGPFLFPGSSNFIMSAIAPFAINFKSIVLDSSSKIWVKISDNNFGSEVKLTSDSNDVAIMTKGDKICIEVSDRKWCAVHWDENPKKEWATKIAKLYRWHNN